MMIIPNAGTEETLEKLARLPYFSISGLKNLIERSSHECSVILNRWRKRGYILKIKKGHYVTKTYVNRHLGDFDYMLSIAGIINPNSYASMEYVLQQHNILTEATYTVSCVTSKTTRRYHNDIAGFYYKNIRPELFNNYITKTSNGMIVKEATLEKALFDYLYFRPFFHKGRKIKYNVAEDLRLNLDVFTADQIERFNALCQESGIKKMVLLSQNFKEYGWNQS